MPYIEETLPNGVVIRELVDPTPGEEAAWFSRLNGVAKFPSAQTRSTAQRSHPAPRSSPPSQEE